MDFLRIIFFAKTILLTPNPVDIHGKLQMNPPAPLEAITSGAELEIDVTSMISMSRGEDVLSVRKKIADKFSNAPIEAHLIGDNGVDVTMRFAGYSTISNSEARLVLAASPGVPADVKFKTVVVSSGTELNSVSVYWRNYKE